MDIGEPCVTTRSVKTMLTLFADNWDTTVHTDMIISQCEFSSHVYCVLSILAQAVNNPHNPCIILVLKLSCNTINVKSLDLCFYIIL